eukprot:6175193-Pleurochrysis_carterae.AAC.4
MLEGDRTNAHASENETYAGIKLKRCGNAFLAARNESHRGERACAAALISRNLSRNLAQAACTAASRAPSSPPSVACKAGATCCE